MRRTGFLVHLIFQFRAAANRRRHHPTATSPFSIYKMLAPSSRWEKLQYKSSRQALVPQPPFIYCIHFTVGFKRLKARQGPTKWNLAGLLHFPFPFFSLKKKNFLSLEQQEMEKIGRLCSSIRLQLHYAMICASEWFWLWLAPVGIMSLFVTCLSLWQMIFLSKYHSASEVPMRKTAYTYPVLINLISTMRPL